MPEDAKIVRLNTKQDENIVKVVNGYSLLEELGHGSFAVAYRAKKAGVVYCVREQDLYRLDESDRPKALELFDRECEVLSELNHLRIPQLHEHFSVVEKKKIVLYQVQDLVPGECLKSIIVKNGRFSEDKAVDIALQVCDVLGYLHNHERRVIHRDIKPSNLMMDEEGFIRLIDFGSVSQEILSGIRSGGSTTFGTPGYVPLEVLASLPVPQSDIYSLGATILNLCSGLDPKRLQDSNLSINYKPEFRFDNLSLELVVDQCLNRDPDQRPKSAEQLAQYLQDIKEGKSLFVSKNGSGRIKRFFARLVPRSLIGTLVAERADVVAQEQRNGGLLVSGSKQTNIAPGFPTVIRSRSDLVIEQTDKYASRFNGLSDKQWVYPNILVPNRELQPEKRTLLLTADFLHNGKYLGQNGHVNKIEETGVYLPTPYELFAIFQHVNANKNHQDPSQRDLIQENIKWLGNIFRKGRLMTGARWDYDPSGNGNVVQDIGRETQYSVPAGKLVGPDGKILEVKGSDSALEQTFRFRNKEVLNDEVKNITGKDSYYFRINDKPSSKQKRAVVLGVYNFNYNFNINAYDDYSDRPALGVVTQRARDFHTK